MTPTGSSEPELGQGRDLVWEVLFSGAIPKEKVCNRALSSWGTFFSLEGVSDGAHRIIL